MSDNTVILEVNDLHKSYGDHEVLKGISTTIKKGDVLALIGPSGCGKSTFLRSLNLLEVPTSGHVLFEGTDMTDASVDINHVREKIGMVFQQFNLFPHFSVMKNITDAPIHNQKRKKEEVFAEARELLKKVGLEEKEDAYPCELSGGQNQRVAIARALAKNPKLLLCDEPTGALDYATGKQVLKLLQDTCRRDGKTVVVITHNSALTAMADRVITVKNGTVTSMVKNEHIVPVEDIEW